jgi:DNA invertase Pin-like site-specific DNA recombinase
VTNNAEPLRAGIYCRMSLAAMGDTTKVADQERISRHLARQLSWPIAEGVGYPELNGVYTDNNKSAWKRSVQRPGWNAMLGDVDAGKVNAIIVYHGDRLVRQPRDLEKLIDLGESKGIALASPTGTRNLGVPEDRIMLRVIAAFAEGESANTSRRRKAQYERWRLKGRVVTGGRGGRMFGFTSDGMTHVPGEAEAVREVIARVIAGEGIRHIAAALRACGVTTTAGKPMHPLAVRRMIASPRYAGLMPDGHAKAAWEPVITREDWEAANALLTGHAFVLAPGHNARRYLLSGIASCGECGKPMQVLPAYTSNRTGRPVAARYGCLVMDCRKVYRNVTLLDAYVTRRVLNRLAHAANPAGQIPDAPGLAAQFAALTTQRAETAAAISDPGQALAPLQARLENIDQRLAELRELAAGDARHRLLATHTGIGLEEFGRLPLAVRRALIAACYQVTVLPASGRGPGFRTEDVRLTPR